MLQPARALAAAGLVLALAGACGGGGPSDSDDSDGDTIRNVDEQWSSDVNTDADDYPDWLDLDSDGDGLRDADEAGDADPATPPVDTDHDGMPDFRDPDSDGDGVPDSAAVGVDGTPIDTDGDGISDAIDPDDDGDGITDLVESRPPGRDTDHDGVPDRLDTDSDGDGVPDAIEGAIDTDSDGIADAYDLDSDDDGLPDADEDRDGDGVVDDCGTPAAPPCESSRVIADTDGDGVPDLIESVAGTIPTDAASTIPDGDFYFVLPFGDPPQEGVFDFSTTLRQADVFFSVDTTGSFGEEIAAIQASIDTLIVPGVVGVIAGAQFGAGRFEDYPRDPFGLPSDLPFELLQSITGDGALLRAAIDALPPAAGGLDTPEAGMEALYQWATGAGIPELAIDPFAPGDVGGAGFRTDSLPIVVQITDARSHAPPDYLAASIASHSRDGAVAALGAIGARVIGVRSIENDGNADDPLDELVDLALATRATIPPTAGSCATGIDGAPRAPVATAGGDVCPLVFDVRTDGTGLGDIIVDAIQQLASLGTLDISAVPVGETTGLRGEMLPPGTTTADFITAIVPEPPAPAGATISGDTFVGVTPGSTVSFRLHAQNDFVPHGPRAQLFQIYIHVLGDAVTLLDVRNVYVIVPRDTSGPVLM